ncbi:MAG: 50S ribosomal protein L21 [bacterium]|nr:50S ribosomal protein L21 [bacterium]
MYAIVETGGKQYKVEQGSTIDVEKLEVPIGEEIKLDRILLVADNDDVRIGNPTITSANVLAQVVAQDRGKKIIVMKFRRRKHYQRKAGHRQDYTKLLIKAIEI